MVAALVKDLQLAEDAVQDACLVALREWPRTGLPKNAKGWLVGTARHKALDRIRREALRPLRELSAMSKLGQPLQAGDPLAHVDEQLALILTCCHPALDSALQVALTLRAVCGLTTAEIAAAFLVPEATMAKRLVRGKNKIRNAGIALRVPDPKALPSRLDAVLRVIYLIYTEGHMASGGDQLVRGDLCDLAIHLAREMLRLLPSEPEVLGLLSLLLLTDSRRHARVDARGQLVLLSNQDRSRWNQDQIIEGRELVLEALRIGRPGRYQLWAAIAASHSEASSAAETDWVEILGLYDALLDYEPTDVVRANRAIAVVMVHGAVAGLEILDSLDAKAAMNNWPQWHVARAELLRQLQRTEDAIEAYSGALAAVPSSVATYPPAPRRVGLRQAISRSPVGAAVSDSGQRAWRWLRVIRPAGPASCWRSASRLPTSSFAAPHPRPVWRSLLPSPETLLRWHRGAAQEVAVPAGGSPAGVIPSATP